jgi:hypothetical protein
VPIRGETIGVAYVRVLADGEGLDRSIEDAFEDQEKTFKQQGKEGAGHFNEGFDEEFLKDFGQKLRDALDVKEMKDFEKQWRADMRQISNDTQITTNKIAKEFQKVEPVLLRHATLVSQGQRDWKKFREENKRGESGLHRLSDRFTHLGDLVGKGFGKGARNNFLNLFGVAAAAPFKLLSGAVDGVAKSMSAFQSLSGFFLRFATDGPDGAGKIAKSFAGIAAAGSLMAATVGGAVLVMGALMAIAGPLMSLLAGLAGIVVALAASLTFALGGALVAVAGALIPVAGLIAGLAFAYKSLNEEQKKTFDPLIEKFKKLKSVFATNFMAAFGDTVDNLMPIFKVLNPLVAAFGTAIGDVVNQWGKATQSATFTKFMQTFTTFLPEAIRTVGTIAQNVGGILGGAFRAAAPFIQDFLDWLAKVTGDFNTWINSAEGQNSVAAFLDKAKESAKSVGKFLEDALVSLGALLGGPAKKEGDNIFDSMARQLRRFTNYLKDPKNQQAISDWFADARKLANQIGRAADKAREFMDKLDTPESRKNLRTILEIVTKIWGIINFMISAYNKFAPSIKRSLPFIESVKTGFKNLKSTIDNVKRAVDLVRIAIGVMRDRARTAWQDIQDKADAVKQHWQEIPDAIVDGFTGLGARIAAAIGEVLINIRISIPNPGNIPRSLFDKAVDKVTASGGIFNGAQMRIIGEAGPEAVVPLNRALSRVDPAVRALSAFAQGLNQPSAAPVPSMASGGVVAPRPIDVTIITPTKDPHAVALETINRLTAVGY